MLEGLDIPKESLGVLLGLRLELSYDDQLEFDATEARINKGLESFFDVGEALILVRDNGWYKSRAYRTFEDYCKMQWNLGRSRAYQLIEAAVINNQLKAVLPASVSTVVDTTARLFAAVAVDDLEAAVQLGIFDNFPSVGDPAETADADTPAAPPVPLPVPVPLPANEAQIRPLTRVDASDRPAVWQDAAKRAKAEGKPITARHVAEAANDHFASASHAPAAGQTAPPAPGTSSVFPAKPSIELQWEGPIYQSRYYHRDEDGNDQTFQIEIRGNQAVGGPWQVFVDGQEVAVRAYVRAAQEIAAQVIQERIAAGKVGG